MKKFVSILLTLVMILTMNVCVLAAENTTLNINDDGNREYAGYQLLNLTTSLKTGEHHPNTCIGENHSSDCYNYAYTVNEVYREILQKEVFDNGGNYLWEGGAKPAAATDITDAQILKYLDNQTSDNGDVYHTMRQVADRIYRAIKNEGIEAEKTLSTDDTNMELEQGYWIIADVTNLTGNAANSLVMVNTKGQDALEINPKTGLSTVEKKVKDIEDSEDGSIEDNPWHDSADHDFGDVVPFKLTGTLPNNAQYYQTFKMVFHDTLSAGLTLNAGSIKVYMYETKHKADVDTDMNDGADVTEKFVVNTSTTDGCTFEVGCDNVFTINGVTKDTAFVVYYTATLENTAVIGSAGNPNEVFLEFSNDPYGDSTGKTETDKVTVFTYQLVVNKTDSHGHALKGAGFTLYKKDVNGDYQPIGAELKGTDMTTFTWKGIDDGDYKLEESTVPEGYNKMSDIVFSISAVHSETAGEPTLVSLDGGLMGTGVVDTGAITKDIVNNTGAILPSTGAMGTIAFVGIGTMFVIVAAVFMITRKKMSIYED